MFYTSCCQLSYDIIIITESWLNDSVKCAELFPPSYGVIRCDRNLSSVHKSDGGGVLVGLREHIKYESLDVTYILKLIPLVDLVVCKCTMDNFSFFLVSVYIPPNLSVNDSELLFEHLEILLVNKPVLIIGDFSILEFAAKSSSPKAILLSHFCNTLELIQSNKILNSHDKLLDILLSNIPLVIVLNKDQ